MNRSDYSPEERAEIDALFDRLVDVIEEQPHQPYIILDTLHDLYASALTSIFQTNWPKEKLKQFIEEIRKGRVQ